MIRVRNIGLIILAVLAVGVMLSTPSTVTSYEEEIDSALREYAINESNTKGRSAAAGRQRLGRQRPAGDRRQAGLG